MADNGAPCAITLLLAQGENREDQTTRATLTVCPSFLIHYHSNSFWLIGTPLLDDHSHGRFYRSIPRQGNDINEVFPTNVPSGTETETAGETDDWIDSVLPNRGFGS